MSTPIRSHLNPKASILSSIAAGRASERGEQVGQVPIWLIFPLIWRLLRERPSKGLDMTITEASVDITDEGWIQAGHAWSHAATDWAYGFEPYARDAIDTILGDIGVGPNTRLLDVACGAGMALGRAHRLGATVSGIDAARGLLDIAARRAPDASLVHGTMFDLPWDDDSFDAVLAFNGVWGGCDEVVAEMARVCMPGGRIAFTFRGDSDRLDLLEYFLTLGASGPGVSEEIVSLAAINSPGEAERIAAAAGFIEIERSTTEAILELANDDEAWRVLRSPGLAVPSLQHSGEDVLRKNVLKAIAPFRSDDGSYRLTNELVHLIARLPGG